MDAADLDRQARTLSGCIPPRLVSRLLELGHSEEVEFQASRGEWFCAREWARLLGDQGRQAEALDVLAPYVATGWWPAARTQAELLERWGRAEEAIALARPYASTGGLPLEFLARILARHGRTDEAVTRLSTGIEDWLLATALVDIAEGAGQDEDIAALLAAQIPDRHRCDGPWCCRGLDPDTAIGLLAVIRERQGRVDEAIALLHSRQHITSVNNHDQLADLLARHDRIEELRAYAASEYLGHAARRLAEVLEERDDVEGAIAVYRQPGDSPVRECHGAVRLSQLLARHGRGDEAIEVMRTLVDAPGGAEDWLVDTLCTLYSDHGRPRDGLACLDALKARRDGEEEWDFSRLRLRLMADDGLLDEAIEQARAHPEGDTWYAAWTISDLLAETGRIEEAVAVLEPHAPANSSLLAGHLIDLGRIKDAVALLQQRKNEPVTPVSTGLFSTEPPF
ncbi:putative negative regulator of RcsB-dependent stress response [Streptomyces sp. V4I23]|uniref:tetratricopeptide repeat protein n=1 Tax=Streptomyces sp. V4I23 TaxID=3042282 RepID=UPI00278336F2|nr:tetratricopeptide repeat protein [Streptomyces sp. V4I23]MDQ1010309.1 putative negative regulator of RcsB-dependent stress response [Streptomyces sp. V4I23]